MTSRSEASPWLTVRSRIAHFEDALALIWLFEYRQVELLANACSLADVLDGLPSERGVAAWLAERMAELDGGGWTYADLYGPSRGPLTPTADEVQAFVQRCAEAGVRLQFADGSPLG